MQEMNPESYKAICQIFYQNTSRYHLTRTVPLPVLTVPLPVLTVPLPALTVPLPVLTVPLPVLTVPLPVLTVFKLSFLRSPCSLLKFLPLGMSVFNHLGNLNLSNVL